MNDNIHNVQIYGGFEVNPVLVKGEGGATVYLHGIIGQEWGSFLDGLSTQRRVYAPAHAGSNEPDELAKLDSIHDLVIYYDELFTELGLDQVDLIGHSFGGMVAAEIAAAYPDRVRRLVLIDPLGLWRDDLPVEDYLLIPQDRQNALLLGDVSNDAVRTRLALLEDQKEQIQSMLHRITSLASASHFLWPIPERGLAKRLHRVKAETLVIWGEDDRFISPAYAEDFARQIAGTQIEIIPGAGHSPHIEQSTRVLDRVQRFLSGGANHAA
jgi:pimeloyl-ACP methyl ester carboxylesterase